MKISKKPSKNENSFPKEESNSRTPGNLSDVLTTTLLRQGHFYYSIFQFLACQHHGASKYQLLLRMKIMIDR